MPTPEGSVNPGISCPTAPEPDDVVQQPLLQQPHGPGPARLHRAGVGRACASARRTATSTADSLPNGVDFWWDEFPGNVGNCWFDNTGSDGTAASRDRPGRRARRPSSCPRTARTARVTATPPRRPSSSTARCGSAARPPPTVPACDWFTNPPEPGSAAAKRAQRSQERAASSDSCKRRRQPASRSASTPTPQTPDEVMAARTAANEQIPASDPAKFGARPLGQVTAGSVAQLAQCSDWKQGNPRAAPGDDRRHPRSREPPRRHRADPGAQRLTRLPPVPERVLQRFRVAASGSTSSMRGPPASPSSDALSSRGRAALTATQRSSSRKWLVQAVFATVVL